MNWFKQIFLSSNGQMSSKRVCGVIGFIICIIVLLYCTVKIILAPDMVEGFMFGCMGLLGLDSVTNIWKNKEE